MKLDREINADGKGKYALINLRKIPGPLPSTPSQLASAIEDNPECVEFGEVGSDNEFFVLKLKDKFVPGALEKYVTAVINYIENSGCSPEEYNNLEEYLESINALLERAGENHSNCKIPD